MKLAATLAPRGSVLWLAQHEARLMWRQIANSGGGWLAVLGTAGLLLFLHVVAAFAVSAGTWPVAGRPPSRGFAGMLTLFGTLLIVVAISSIFTSGVKTLFQSEVQDLVLTSPIPGLKVLQARVIALVALTAFPLMSMLIPFANVGAIKDNWRWLSFYPLSVALALGTASIAIPLLVLAVQRLGVRRAQVLTSAVAVLFGASLYIAQYRLNKVIYDHSAMQPVATAIGSAIEYVWHVTWFIPIFIGWLMVVCLWLARSFQRGTITGATASRARQLRALRPTQSRGLAWRFFAKEWRLFLRDWTVLPQVLAQSLYVIPLAFIGTQKTGLHAQIVAFTICAALVLARPILWVFTAAEAARDLVFASPHSPERIRAMKAWAGVMPFGVIVALAALSILPYRWDLSLIALALGLLAIAQFGYEAWVRPRTGDVANFQLHYGRGDLLGTLLSMIAVMGYYWAILLYARGMTLGLFSVAAAFPHIAMVLLSEPETRIRPRAESARSAQA